MYGYMGKLLFVDLGTGAIEKRPLDPELARNFVGGHALGAAVLFREMPAHADVFGPDSMLGFVSSPANNAGCRMGGRWTVVSKSPVTGGINDANSGGLFSVMLRKSGYDAVFVKGIAPRPVYILVDNGEVEIRDAEALWGLTTVETEQALKARLGDRKFDAAIAAPGAERMAFTAAIMNDSHRAAGRGGSGAVMGSKKLKALVCCGDQALEVFDPEAVKEIGKTVTEWYRSGPTAGGIRAWQSGGTNNDFMSNMLLGDASTKNWAGAAPRDMTEEQIQPLTTQNTDPRWKKRKFACASCPLGCGAIYDLSGENCGIEESGRAEYETVGAFGSQMLCNDPLTVQKCNFYCNEYGLDTISVGATVAWAMECHEKGILSAEELDGVDLTWGNGAAIEAMTLKICRGEGVGRILMNGSRYAAEKFGKGFECLVVAGGIEIPQHDARWNPGMARTYKYDPTPGRHVKGGLGPGFGGEAPEVRFAYGELGARDAAGMAMNENLNTFGFCNFAGFGLPGSAPLDYVNAVTGFRFSAEEAMDLGKRSFAIRAAFNQREGYVPRRDATISDRIIGKPAMAYGPHTGVTVDVELMADRFFENLHYDPATGNPTAAELRRLGGMENVIEALFPEEA